ncbi:MULTISPECIES: hypothetical protein [unclassified Nocardioides]|uniref:hypothetical protein n=1 Tax=unclassified Nocardioides TaxID=2615069 RepID=UPI000056FAE3|nr:MULTISPECIES: hypothetical protein [unclassified Nocardioides]ABL82910.1 hypothetical protein Noca_3410 [Nocardioides sp. JS614]
MTDLRRPKRRSEYVDSGPAIYVDSFATIRREAGLRAVPADAEKLAATVRGRRGGSAMTSSALNALAQEAE